MINTAYRNTRVSDGQTIVSYDNGACTNLNYTVYSSCDDCKAVLVFTSDGKKVSRLMNVTDNQKLNQSWSILQLQSDYHALAFDYAKKFIGFDGDSLTLSQDYYKSVNSVIENFFMLTPESLKHEDYDFIQLFHISNKL